MQAVSLTIGGDGTLDVVLRGEIDFTNAAEIGEELTAAVARSLPKVIQVDLAEVTFLDSSGIGLLVTAMREAERAGAAYRVTRPAPPILDQLRTVGLVHAFGLTPSDLGR